VQHDIVVVGAGAAGLWCAARLGELGARVLLLEKTPRAGTKVLASGGTHCNLTTTLGEREAARLFGLRGERFLRHAFRVLPPRAVRERFHELGVPTVEAPLEKIFPASGRARDVRDALLKWALSQQVELRYEHIVRTIQPHESGWMLEVEQHSTGEVRRVQAPQLVLALGGKSYASTGTTGDAYAWLQALGLQIITPVPALVPLTSQTPWVVDLAGIALEHAHARLVDRQGRLTAERARPVLFTHQGLSGPGAMDLSEPFARAESERRACEVELCVDLVPHLSQEALRDRILEAAARTGAPQLARALELDLPRRVMDAALTQAGLATDVRANAVPKPQRHALSVALKGLRVPIDGTRGFDWAEVTAGGLALDEVEPGSCAVRRYPSLYVIGELLDLQGPIGGLNFQAAFATAEIAARACQSHLAARS